MRGCELSVVIPLYNEEKNAGNTAKSVESVLKGMGISYEIILVNNGSTDSTPEIINSIIRKNRAFRKVDIRKNKGYGWGIISGLGAAKGRYLGYIDGDGQFGFDNIKQAYMKMKKEGLDLCKGYRIMREDSIQRNMVSLLYNALVKALFFTNAGDFNAKPKLMTRKCYESLGITSKDWFIDTEIMLKSIRKGYRFGEVPLQYIKRTGGKSNVRATDVLQFLKNLILFRLGMLR